MATYSLAADHRATIDAVARRALSDLVVVWRQTADLPTPQATAALLDLVPDITTAYGDVAATVAADYYAESRADVPGSFRPTLAAPLPIEQVHAVTRWAVGPLWSDTPDHQAALRQLAQGTDRLVRLGDRRTIIDNAARDPQAQGTVRLTRPDACGFCLLMVTRIDHASLTPQVAAERSDRWHGNCKCGTAPRFGESDDDWPDPNDLYGEFLTVTDGLGGARARQAWDRHVRAQR